MEPQGGMPFVWAIFTVGVGIAFFHLFCCSPYNRRNTLLRCGNPRSFTQSKLPRVFLARLVLLGSKTSKERSSICLLLRRLIDRISGASHCRAYGSARARTQSTLPRSFRTLLDLLASPMFEWVG